MIFINRLILSAVLFWRLNPFSPTIFSKKYNMKKLPLLLAVLLPTSIFAHGGHGIFDPHTLMHYLGTTEHGLPILAVSLVAGWMLYRRYRKARA